MCGIAGIIDKQKKAIDRAVIESMTRRLSHRGPDAEGIKLFYHIALGHRRLSIIDLQTGDQPMSNEDGQCWITFNGEIYNYKELRSQLETAGHVFRTRSDTEVVIHAYEEWGEKCVTRFRGMFAFGIVDLRSKHLFLARDHFGIKPLYYLENPQWFAFASEIQAFKSIPRIDFSIDLNALDYYLWLQYIPAPHSIYKQVKKLPPASYLFIPLEHDAPYLSIPRPCSYWNPTFDPDYTKTEDQWVEEWEHVVKESVKAHLVSDVPFGAFLSGGIDSSAVVAYMSRVMDQPVKTFSIGFEEEAFNELPYARVVVNRWQTEHHEKIVKPDTLEILPLLVKHYGEPFGDSSAIPTYFVSQFAREYVPMVLSGDGGDEFFAGYESYRQWIHFAGTGSRQITLGNWLSFIQYYDFISRKTLWKEPFKPLAFQSLPLFETLYGETPALSPVHKVQYMDIKTYLPFDILTKVDIAAMIHGLETRTPLVDIEVAQFALTMPENITITQDETGSWSIKQIPKKVLGRYYSQDFIHRPKKGFAYPIRDWFNEEGKLSLFLHQRLLSPGTRLRDFFDPNEIKRTVESRAAGKIWLLLVLDEWLKQDVTFNIEEPPVLSVDLETDFFNPCVELNTVSSSRQNRWEYIMEKASLLENRGDDSPAEELLKALVLNNDVPLETKAKTRYRLGSLLKRLGRLTESEAYFLDVLSQTEDSNLGAGACFHLGDLHWSKGEKEKSREYWSRCLEINPHHRKAAEKISDAFGDQKPFREKVFGFPKAFD